MSNYGHIQTFLEPVFGSKNKCFDVEIVVYHLSRKLGITHGKAMRMIRKLGIKKAFSIIEKKMEGQ